MVFHSTLCTFSFYRIIDSRFYAMLKTGMLIKITSHPHFIPWFLFIFFSSLYFVSGNGGINSGDGSAYALTKALVEDKTIQIDNHIQWTYSVDYGESKGHFYLDREPGLSFLGAPFYVIGKFLSPLALNPYPGVNGRLTSESKQQLLTYITNAFFGALAVVFVYLISLQFTGSKKASFITAMAAGSGTLLWKYSSSYFREPVFTTLLLGSLYFLLLESHKPKMLIFSAFLFGLSLFVDYSKFYIFFIVFIYVLIEKFAGRGIFSSPSLLAQGKHVLDQWLALRSEAPKGAQKRLPDLSKLNRTHLIYFLKGLLIPLLLIFSYNFLAFGNPFTNPHLHKSYFTWMQDSSTLFQIPLIAGIRTNLINNGPIAGDVFSFFRNHPDISKQYAVELYHTWNYKGILVQTPLLLAATAGWILLVKRKKKDIFLLLTISISIFLITSKLSVFWGSINQDGRYFIPTVILWLIGLSVWIKYMEKMKNLIIKNVFIFLTLVLFLISVYNGWYSSLTQFAPGNTGFYRFTFSQLKYPFQSFLSENLSLLIRHTFPNLINLFWLPLYFLLIYGIFKLFHFIYSRPS